MKKQKKSPKDVSVKSLFDHVSQIRNIKDLNYIKNCSESDLKSFNHYMICRFLSMDPECISEIAFISKYFDKMDHDSFYRLCCEVTTPTKYTPYIKKQCKEYDQKLIDIVCKYFEIGSDEAKQYINLYFSEDSKLEDLKKICKFYGLTDKEVDKMMKYE